MPMVSNKATVTIDAAGGIVLPSKLLKSAGVSPREKLIISATPGRIVLEVQTKAKGRVEKRGKLKVWTGRVPGIPIEQAVALARPYTR